MHFFRKVGFSWNTLAWLCVFSSCVRKNKTAGLFSSAPGASLISIVGINDLHGSLAPTEVKLTSKVSATGSGPSAMMGGLPLLSGYLKIHKKNFPNTLILDAGDTYQGTLLSNLFEGRSTLTLLNEMGIQASTFGNHEFDFTSVDFNEMETPRRETHFNFPFSHPISSLLLLLKEAKFDYLAANIRKQDQSEEDALPVPRGKIYSVGGVQIGVIGAATETTPKFAPKVAMDGMQFISLEKSVPAESKRLREQGAQLVLLLTHTGGSCRMNMAAELGDEACAAPEADELTAFLGKFPGVVDGVVAGHSHLPQAHYIKGVPVIQTHGFGTSFGVLNIEPDSSNPSTKFKITPQKPVFVCESHFSNYSSCNPFEEKEGGSYPAEGIGEPVPATYLGAPVKADEVVRDMLIQWQKKIETIENKKVAEISKDLILNRETQSKLSDCFTDLLQQELKRQDTQTDLVILGTGQLRSSLNAGLVTFGALYRVLPGDDLLAVADLKPEEAQDLVRAMSLKGGNAVTVAVSSGWQAKEEQTTPRINSIKPPAELAQKSTWKVATTEWKFRGFPEIVGKAEKEGRIRYFANKTLRDTIAAGLGGVLPSRCQ